MTYILAFALGALAGTYTIISSRLFALFMLYLEDRLDARESAETIREINREISDHILDYHVLTTDKIKDINYTNLKGRINGNRRKGKARSNNNPRT